MDVPWLIALQCTWPTTGCMTLYAAQIDSGPDCHIIHFRALFHDSSMVCQQSWSFLSKEVERAAIHFVENSSVLQEGA